MIITFAGKRDYRKFANDFFRLHNNHCWSKSTINSSLILQKVIITSQLQF